MRKVPMKTKGGNLAKNQIRVFDTDGTHFYSYGKKVATFRSFSSPSVILYAPWWDMYSQTTNNYLLQFLDEESIKDIRKKVISGDYFVA